MVYSPEPHHVPLEKKDMKEVLPRGKTHSQEGVHDGFHHMIGAIHISQYSGIRDLKIEARPVDLPENIGAEFHVDIFRFRNASHIEAGKFFFQQLRKIDMTFTPSSLNGRNGPVGAQALECLGNLAALLAEARDLEVMSLGFSDWHPDPHSMYGGMVPHARPFSYLGLGITWPKLRSLRLGGIFAEEGEVKELINRHKETLTSLQFSKCSLSTGQWSNIVDEVLFGTNIAQFGLGHVNEVHVGETNFAALSVTNAARWEYEGQLAVTEEGERVFEEPPDKSVYSWRHLDQGMDET